VPSRSWSALRVYVAGSTRDTERINKVQGWCRDLGWDITFDWTGPEVPPAWHAALSLKRGTLVYTHP